MKDKEIKTQKNCVCLIPGKLCKCYYCDVDNGVCGKYGLTRYAVGDYTWENYCLKDGGCNR